jgi:hypothetical protein
MAHVKSRRRLGSIPLALALQQVDLRPGEVYREWVNGRTVEVHVLEDQDLPDLSGQVMHEPWAAMPFEPCRTLTVELGFEHLPQPVAFDESDMAPE